MSELDYSKDIAGLKNSFGLLKPSEFDFIQARRAQKITPQLDVLDRNRAIERKERSEDLAYKTAKQNFKASKMQIEEQDKAREALRDATWKLPNVLEDNSLSTEEKITSVNTFLLENPQLNAAYPSIGRSALDTLRFKSQKEQQEKAEAETKLRREEARERNIRQYTLTAASSISTPEGQDYFKRAQAVLDKATDRDEAEGAYFRTLTNIMAAEGRATVDLQKQRDQARVEAARLSVQNEEREEKQKENDATYKAYIAEVVDYAEQYQKTTDVNEPEYAAALAKGAMSGTQAENKRQKAFPAKNEKAQMAAFYNAVDRDYYFDGKLFKLDMDKVKAKRGILATQFEVQEQLRKAKAVKRSARTMTQAEILARKAAEG